ncbi:MAG: winged helix-turn-helix domain-containing protein [Leptolyngbyaceae cyanobacterium HOT.MB2.61]|nr:winged helix-turn-helix domain-containing protein [Leptolyngbyaceae cyanobacterium HOT.MB2.61]
MLRHGYQSRQSYDTLLKQARFSWKQPHSTHPDRDETQVEEKTEIMELLVHLKISR